MTLTTRELQVIEARARGESFKSIAYRLEVTIGTVCQWQHRALDKTGSTSAASALAAILSSS